MQSALTVFRELHFIFICILIHTLSPPLFLNGIILDIGIYSSHTKPFISRGFHYFKSQGFNPSSSAIMMQSPWREKYGMLCWNENFSPITITGQFAKCCIEQSAITLFNNWREKRRRKKPDFFLFLFIGKKLSSAPRQAKIALSLPVRFGHL